MLTSIIKIEYLLHKIVVIVMFDFLNYFFSLFFLFRPLYDRFQVMVTVSGVISVRVHAMI